jgi:hypothetical protein
MALIKSDRRVSATLTRRDLSLPKTPTGAMVPSKPPGIGRMSFYANSSMKSKNLKSVCYLLGAVASGAVPVAASADQKSCPDRIVVGKHGPYDEYAYFNKGTTYSASIPSKPGEKTVYSKLNETDRRQAMSISRSRTKTTSGRPELR